MAKTNPTDEFADVIPLSKQGAPVASTLPVVYLGRIVGLNDVGMPLVAHDSMSEPVPARFTNNLDREAIQAAIGSGQQAVLMFVHGDAKLPVIIGLLQPSVPTKSPETQSKSKTLHLHGDRVVVEGKDEIVLRTKHGSITVRRNGKVVVRGMYVETRSDGVHRIKGAKIEVN